MKTTRLSGKLIKGYQKKEKQLMKLYMKQSYEQLIYGRQKIKGATILSDRQYKQNQINSKNGFNKMKSNSPRYLRSNVSCQNINSDRIIDQRKKYQQGKNCRIIILYRNNQIQLYFSGSNIQKLIQLLANNISSNFYYQSKQCNLSLDFILTQPNINCLFLNSKCLYLNPIEKIKCSTINLRCFDIIKPIGCGGFSNVYLCKFKEDGKFYALKLINKEVIVKNKKKRIIMNERNIMKISHHPFLIDMKFAFQTDKYLAFVLEYCVGGQLFGLIKKNRRISQKKARFYIIQILLGLGYLHQNQIVYRDIKPENILIGIDGHIKIADLGLAKPNMGPRQMAYSFCGSPQYMSPQMILQQGHTFPVDFYCTGALLYELLTGLPPFYSRNPDQIYNAVLNEDLMFPNDLLITDECISLLKGLLNKDYKHRLGSLYGIKQILAHPWFGKNNYDKFLKKQISPPLNFEQFSKINLNQNMDQKDYKLLKEVQIQRNSKIPFKSVMKQFYYDYRKQYRKSIISQQKQNIIKKGNFRYKSNTNQKIQIPSLQITKKLKRKISSNKLQHNSLSTKR